MQSHIHRENSRYRGFWVRIINMASETITLTNEEKRVVFYANTGVPTTPFSVTSNTPLEDLNLNWREKDLPERERTKHVHRLHSYLGKFIPQLVEVFLRKYFRPGQTILDPFAGSGTTLVQANELGINSIGYDISAFNVMLIKAKTKSYNLDRVKLEILDILEKTKEVLTLKPRQLSLLEKKAIYGNGKYLQQWFDPNALRELLTYRDLIKNYEDQDLLKIVLSRSARSARLTTHFDLDFPKKPQTEPYWCYKHGRTCTPTTSALQFISRYSLDTIRRLEEFSRIRTKASVEVIHGDSRFINLPKIDGIITSPPYVGLIDYHEQHRYAYELFGLEDKSELEIGSAEQGVSKKAQTNYQKSIADVFRKSLDVMPSGGYLIVIAGDKNNLYDEIARLCNVKTEAVIQRHVNRRTGRRASEFYESVFVWRKP